MLMGQQGRNRTKETKAEIQPVPSIKETVVVNWGRLARGSKGRHSWKQKLGNLGHGLLLPSSGSWLALQVSASRRWALFLDLINYAVFLNHA